MFLGRCSALWAHSWSLWANLGAYGLTFEGLGPTLEAHGVTLGAFELQFSSPWGHLGVILAAIGSVLGSLGCSKSSKMHQECKVVDIVKTLKNLMFLKGFEGWRHPSELQNELLETLEAGLGADEVIQRS